MLCQQHIDMITTRRSKPDVSKLHNFVRSDWVHVTGRSGISLSRSLPSPFLEDLAECDDIWTTHWREVADRSSMETRLEAYFQKKELNIDSTSYEKAWHRVEETWRSLGNVEKPCGVTDALRRLPKGTSPGLPHRAFGPYKKRDVEVDAVRSVRAMWKRFSTARRNAWSAKVWPCIAAARRVIRPRDENKPRLVWAYPYDMTILETQFSGPITDLIQSLKPSWMGWTTIWQDYGRSIERLTSQKGIGGWLTVDKSGFDANVCAMLIRRAFTIIRNMYVKLTSAELNALKLIEEYFIHTPLLFYNSVIQKHRGIPSGSSFTQLIGTIVNMFYDYYVDAKLQFDCIAWGVWLGDDSRLGVREVTAETAESRAKHYLEVGAIVHPDKCAQSVTFDEDGYCASFLSRELFRSYPPLRFDFRKFMAQVFIPEDLDKTPEDVYTRLVGLVWAYGYNSDAYRLLSRCREHVFKTHGPQTVNTASRFWTRIRYWLNVTPETHWPDYSRLHSQYFGYF